MRKIILITIIAVTALAGCKKDEPEEEKIEYDFTLVNAINNYRIENGLPAIAVSEAMMKVAWTHAKDLSENYEFGVSECSLHSWSENGDWSACCYTNDHSEAECMWDKPRELTNYQGNGYEVAFYNSSVATVENSLASWKGSEAHNNVLLNLGVWHTEWKAVGAAMNGKYAVVWFGNDEDVVVD